MAMSLTVRGSTARGSFSTRRLMSSSLSSQALVAKPVLGSSDAILMGAPLGLNRRQHPRAVCSGRSSALTVSASASTPTGGEGADAGIKGPAASATEGVSAAVVTGTTPETATGGGEGGNGAVGNGGGGGGGGGGDGGGDDDEDELLNLTQAEEIASAKGLELPADFVAAAQSGGLRLSALNAWVAIQGVGIYAFISKLTPIFRDRLIADERFLFKVLAEVAIDSGCATVAEVTKRGSEFWDEFEFYLSDLLVGLVLDVFIITCIAPVAVIGAQSGASKKRGIARVVAGFPSAFFEKSIKGVKEYSFGQRLGCLAQNGLMYGAAGAVCGMLGQAIANQGMLLKRHMQGGAKESDVAIPDVGTTGLTWGVFMAGSSNLRYQAVFGLERLVEMTPLAQNRAINNAISIVIRYTNNIYGGANFIDHARFFGCQ